MTAAPQATDTPPAALIPAAPAASAPLRVVLCDRHLLGWAGAWTAVVLLVFGVVTAIIPNPIFGRGIPPAPFAVAVWLVSSPLMGLVLATYVAPASLGSARAHSPGSNEEPSAIPPSETADRGSTLGTIGGLGAFVAIGCPTCNKIALLLLGASGAVSIFGPLQPVIGAASLVLLVGTLVWRLRLRARGGACARPT